MGASASSTRPRITGKTACALTILCLGVLAIGACIVLPTAEVDGISTSSRKIKKRLLDSTLFHTFNAFYPDGVVRFPYDKFPESNGVAVRYLQSQIQDVIAGLERFAAIDNDELSRWSGKNLQKQPRLQLELGNYGSAICRVDPKGRLLIDSRVVFAIFSASLRESRRTDVLSSLMPTAPEDATDPSSVDLINSFVGEIERVKAAKGGTALHDVINGGSDLMKMDALSAATERTDFVYAAAWLFVIAHEMGHLALGHTADRGHEEDCSTFSARELDADRYAAIVGASVTGGYAIFDAIGLENYQALELARGYEVFLGLAYRRSGLGVFEPRGECTYPDPESRIQAAREVVRKILKERGDEIIRQLNKGVEGYLEKLRGKSDEGD